MIVFMIVCWNLWSGFSHKIESMYLAFLDISMGTIASGLGPRLLTYMVLPLEVLLPSLDTSNWLVSPFIVLSAFWI